jgi:hypothetical protein
MTARTVITPVALARDTLTYQGAGVTPAAAGNTIADPGPNHLVLTVANGATVARTITVRASGSGNDAAGNAQSVPPQETVFAQATRGDLVVSIPAAQTWTAPPLTSDRFTQPDGSLSIDFDTVTSVTVWAFTLPYNPLGGATL